MKNTIVLVADAAYARVFQSDAHFESLSLVESLEHPASRLLDSELTTDRPGRSHKGISGGHQVTYDAPSSHHELEEERFAVVLLEKLSQQVTAHPSTRVVLVAAPHFLGLLRKHMPDQVGARVVASLDKDLTHTPDHELGPALQAAIR